MSETGAMALLIICGVAALAIYSGWKTYRWRLVWLLCLIPFLLAYKALKLTAWGAGRVALKSGRARVKDPETSELVGRKMSNPAKVKRIAHLGHGKHLTPAGLADGVHMVSVAESGAAKGQSIMGYE